MKKWLLLLLCLPFFANASWQDFWQTKDQQGKLLLSSGHPKKAALTFKRKDWQSVAHYRAGQYKQAAKLFSSLKPSLNRYYNEGNAKAHLGQYEKALAAYNQALKITPKDPDTLYNKKIVEDLLKKQQKEQEKNKEDQKNNLNNQEQDQQPNQPKPEDPGQNQPNHPNGPNPAGKKEGQDKEDQKSDQGDKKKQEQQKKQREPQQAKKSGAPAPKLSANEKEQQQAQMQRLKRVPDDPGGLLRQKFFRDYIKRHPERW